MDLSRRDFLASGTLAAGASLAGPPSAGAAAPVMLAQAGPAPRGFNPADPALKYDLVIANADVLDPSQTLRGKRDIGIKNGQIAVLSSTPIAAERSAQRYEAAGRLATPTTASCPEGITRAAVLELAASAGIGCEVGDYTLPQLYNAEESFVTGTMGGLAPVLSVDGRTIGDGTPGPVTKRLTALYADLTATTGTPVT